MFDEVEQFIKRVRELQQQQQTGTPPPRPPRPAPVPPSRGPVLDAEIIDAEPVESVRQHVQSHVSSHVTQYLDNRKFTESADRLGDDVEIADDVMDAHIHQAFSHQLGSLQGEDRRDAAAAAADRFNFPADNFQQLLSDPNTLRRAIIVSEILARPTHRWKGST